MRIFDRVKKRFERDNSGGWDQYYKKYIRTSILDRILQIPISDKTIALSHRRYKFPSNVLKNLYYKYGIIEDTGALPEISTLDSSHPLYGISQILSMYDMKFGLMITFDSIKNWEGLEKEEREFTVSFSPIGYDYKQFKNAFYSNGYSRSSSPPKFIYFDESGIHAEGPEFLHVKKQDIYIRTSFTWPKTFSLRIQGNSPADFGYGLDWTNDSAYNG